MLAGINPVLAKKVRYYEDGELQRRILPPPELTPIAVDGQEPQNPSSGDSWSETVIASKEADTTDPANGGIRREPELPEHEEVTPRPPDPAAEFELGSDEPDDDAPRFKIVQDKMSNLARQTSLDPGDHMEL
jgi:type IV secretion system protein VirD4